MITYKKGTEDEKESNINRHDAILCGFLCRFGSIRPIPKKCPPLKAGMLEVNKSGLTLCLFF